MPKLNVWEAELRQHPTEDNGIPGPTCFAQERAKGSIPPIFSRVASDFQLIWTVVNSLVFDITDVSPNATRLDVFRTLNQYAQTMKEQRFKRIILAARGKNKFVLEGDYFQMLGQEYDTQNPMYTMRTFPTHLTAMDGSRPYVEYTGGIFAVLEKELEQFTAFHDAWYVQDFATEIK